MASHHNSKAFVCLGLLLLFCLLQGVLGGVTCEHLTRNTCAFAVSSSGARCVLEKRVRRGGREEHLCRTSGIDAGGLTDWIETDECVEACGLDRNSLGISSDSLVDSNFARKLCSPRCYQSCTNVVDLYFNLAAGEGVFLPQLCEVQENNVRRRVMAEIRSSGVAAPESESGKLLAASPAQSEKLRALGPTQAQSPL